MLLTFLRRRRGLGIGGGRVLRTLRGGGGPCGDVAVSGMRERLRFQGTNAGEGCLLYLRLEKTRFR